MEKRAGDELLLALSQAFCAIDSFLDPQNIVFLVWAPIRDREHSGCFLILEIRAT